MKKCAITKSLMAHDGATGLRRHELAPIVKTNGAFSAPSDFSQRRTNGADGANQPSEADLRAWLDQLLERARQTPFATVAGKIAPVNHRDLPSRDPAAGCIGD